MDSKSTTLAIEVVPIERLYCSPSNPRLNDDAVARHSTTAALPEPRGGDAAPENPRTARKPRVRKRVEVACPDCGRTRVILRESFGESPPRCRSCASRLQNKRRKKKGSTIPCEWCGTTFYKYPSETEKRFCSQQCAGLAKRRYEPESRTCRSCGGGFTYTPRPNSNSSGHYCSSPCRDAGYLGVINGDPSTTARSERRGWKSRRNRFVRHGHNFCAICGVRSAPLHVHHIEGFRNVRHDDMSAVVTVCPKHHARLEKYTRQICDLHPRRRRYAALLILGFLGDSWAYHSGQALREERAG